MSDTHHDIPCTSTNYVNAPHKVRAAATSRLAVFGTCLQVGRKRDGKRMRIYIPERARARLAARLIMTLSGSALCDWLGTDDAGALIRIASKLDKE